MRHNYIANYDFCGQSFISLLSGTNKRKLLSEVYNAAKNARYGDNEASFWVADADAEDVFNGIIDEGRIDEKGRVYYITRNGKDVL